LRHRRYCVVALEKPLAIPIMFLAWKCWQIGSGLPDGMFSNRKYQFG
jgi:hypothetical protein